MRSTFKSVVIVLAFALSLSVAAPATVQSRHTASISGRQIEPPDFTSSLKRFFNHLRHWFGSEPDGDIMTVPRP
jgi:hypothetical protein